MKTKKKKKNKVKRLGHVTDKSTPQLVSSLATGSHKVSFLLVPYQIMAITTSGSSVSEIVNYGLCR